MLRETGADSAPPARACFAVAALPLGGLVEIEATALVNAAPRRVVGFTEGKLFSAAVVGGSASTVWTSGQLASTNRLARQPSWGETTLARNPPRRCKICSMFWMQRDPLLQRIFRSTVFLTGIDQYGPMNTSYGNTLGLIDGTNAFPPLACGICSQSVASRRTR